MNTLSRRAWMTVLGASTVLALPLVGRAAQPKVMATEVTRAVARVVARVVVIGGGAGGASAARQLARDKQLAAQVTLIEPSRSYHSCFFPTFILPACATTRRSVMVMRSSRVLKT